MVSDNLNLLLINLNSRRSRNNENEDIPYYDHQKGKSTVLSSILDTMDAPRVVSNKYKRGKSAKLSRSCQKDERHVKAFNKQVLRVKREIEDFKREEDECVYHHPHFSNHTPVYSSNKENENQWLGTYGKMMSQISGLKEDIENLRFDSESPSNRSERRKGNSHSFY